MSYTPFTPVVELVDDGQVWSDAVSQGIDMAAIGFQTDEQKNQIGRLLRNAHEATTNISIGYINRNVNGLADWMNQAFTTAFTNQENLTNEVRSLRQIVETQAELLRAYKAQLDKLPADAGAGPFRGPKVPDPPTFSGTDNKMTLEDWMNQVALYCSSLGIVTDHQRIVTALTRLRSPATNYMRKYFDDTRLGNDLGSWDNFANELNAIYGRRDNKEGAKNEITHLWTNKSLASKDFIKYAEQYRTLARIVDYQDSIHIDKLRDVISQELRNALVVLEISGKTPTKWEDYLELLLLSYKALHPEKTKSVIFGTGNNAKGNGSHEPDAMEIDAAKKSKGKTPEKVNSQEQKQRYCQICAGKGLKAKSKTHNTVDCWDKPGNEGKRPNFNKNSSSSASASGQGNKGKQPPPSDKKSFKARLMELFDEIDSQEPAPPAVALNVNSTSTPDISLPELAAKGATAHVNEVQAGPSKPSRWARSQQYKADFPEGL